jgi:schlafen family protein
MANLYSDDLASLTLPDIENFLRVAEPENQRPREGPTLDYKLALPSDLGKDVAAFANTYGGLILLGVEEVNGKKGIPSSIRGCDLGIDPRARLTDIIVSTIHPRPRFHISCRPVSASGTYVAAIRVPEGTFPPYEYARGNDILIPLRVEDTSRPATLRDIETLLGKRTALSRTPAETLQQFLNTPEFTPLVEVAGPGGGLHLERDVYVHKMVFTPWVPLAVRLDDHFERDFEAKIRAAFKNDRHFWRTSVGERYEDFPTRTGQYQQYDFRVRGAHPCHRLWRVWSAGAAGFATSHSRAIGPEPVGNLFLDFLLFCRLVRGVLEGEGYFGRLAFAHVLACPGRKFVPAIPVLGHPDDYDKDDSVSFPDEVTPDHPATATFIEELDSGTLSQPHEVIASVLLAQLREICGAKVRFDRFRETIRLYSEKWP